MVIRVCDSFGGTPGAWESLQRIFRFDFDIEKCPYIPDDSIISLANVLWNQKIDTRVRERLQSIQTALRQIYSHDVDPVKYLMYLYYKEWLWIKDVNKRLWELWVSYNSVKSIGNLFVTTFGWELRDRQDRTPIQQRKISNPNSTPIVAMKKHWHEKLKENTEKYRAAAEEILSQTHTVQREFDRNIFDSLKWTSKKAFYLLEIFEGISVKMFYDISELSQIKASTTLAHILNRKLKGIHEKNPHIPLVQVGDASLLNQMKKIEKTRA